VRTFPKQFFKGIQWTKLHINQILNKTRWPPQAILVSDWSISKKSSPLKLPSQMANQKQELPVVAMFGNRS
jgi:hypothetical protein